jgi:CDP-diacylglycerol--serine O-phosphatidyltransferase
VRVDLKKALFVLPNLFTLSSIFCGFYAALLCLGEPTGEDFHRAALLVIFAMLFDAIDGRVARLTRTQSDFGVQLDSLADVCSFGVAPALLVYEWALAPLGALGVAGAFVYLACGAIRLARFNVLAMREPATRTATKPGASRAGAWRHGGSRHGSSKHDEASAEGSRPRRPACFVGLPIPAAAGIVVSLIVANHALADRLPGPSSPALVFAVVIAVSLLMVSAIPFRSFKDLRPTPRTFAGLAVALGSSLVVGWVFHPSFALVWLLGAYVVVAIAEGAFALSRRRGAGMRVSVPPEG